MKSVVTGVFCLFLSVLVTAQEQISTGFLVGQQAPEIAMAGVNGKVLKLSSLRGYLVLVDFWASWCGPCRFENPSVVKAYQTYSKMKIRNMKGFDIFSVSLDKNAEAWKAAIEQDKLDWKYHVSELNGWDNSAVGAYGVGAIPANFLIDGEGIILAKNLRREQLLLELEKYVQY